MLKKKTELSSMQKDYIYSSCLISDFLTLEHIILVICTTVLRRGSYECSRFILNKNQKAVGCKDYVIL